MLKLLSFLGRYWPFSHGTGWLVERPSRFIKTWPKNQLFNLKDGRTFQGDLNDRLFRSLYLYGDYEPLVSQALKNLIRPGDCVVDVGANIGVMTTHMGRLVGSKGCVYSFEPIPFLYEILQKSVLLNDLTGRVISFRLLVGQTSQQEVKIHVPKRGAHPCSTMILDERSIEKSYSCRMVALDTFEMLQAIPALVKVDVEGAERMVLLGAKKWLAAQQPPIWLLEINRKSAARFAYQPEDMISLFNKNYKIYWADEFSWHVFSQGMSLPDNGTLCALPIWTELERRFLP